MNKLRLLLVLFLGILLLYGCKTWDEPDFNIPDWERPSKEWAAQPWAIDGRFVLGKHENNTPPDSLVPSAYGKTIRYIRAVVVSSDEGGNYYKSMVIQDSTAGVELELDMPGLYNTYPVGQKIVLVCNGLVIGDYRGLPQIGWIYQETQVGRINSLFFDQYIIRDGIPSAKNIPKALTSDEIDFLGHDDINKLVRLEKVTFESKAIGEPLAYNQLTATDWIVNVPLANGTTKAVTVRTSSFARFRNMIIEDKEYNITGILTIYRDTYQLMIRTKEDIETFTPPPPGELIKFDFTSDPFGEGKWSWRTLAGSDRWGFREGSVLHRGSTSGALADDWLISPVITFPNWQTGYLHFEHQIDVKNAATLPYQIYYTTSNAETFDVNDWEELGKLNAWPATFSWSNRFPLSKIGSPSFRIAFRYNTTELEPGIATYEWRIRTVEIRK